MKSILILLLHLPVRFATLPGSRGTRAGLRWRLDVGEARVWSAATGDPVSPLLKFRGAVVQVAISQLPSGHRKTMVMGHGLVWPNLGRRATVMNKYWHVLRIGLQNTLVYRANFFFRSAFALVPLLATIYLWRAIYAGRAAQADVAGYSLAKMISYYLVITIVDALTAVTDDDWQVAADIKDGNISQFLLKPIDYLTYRLCLFGAGRLVYTMIALIPLTIFLVWQRAFLYMPASFSTLGWFALSLLLTGLLQFFISYTMALLAFWLLEVSSLILMLFALEYLASGHLFPLDILPPALARLLALTPFPYELFFPVSIYLEQVKGPALYQGLLIQAAWVVVTYALARWVWLRGIKRYAAVGG